MDNCLPSLCHGISSLVLKILFPILRLQEVRHFHNSQTVLLNLFIKIAFGTLNPAIHSGVGYLFDSQNIAYAASSPSMNLGTTFSVGVWAYITDTVSVQYLWCKTMVHVTLVASPRVCVYIRQNTIYTAVNPAASGVIGALTVQNSGAIVL